MDELTLKKAKYYFKFKKHQFDTKKKKKIKLKKNVEYKMNFKSVKKILR